MFETSFNCIPVWYNNSDRQEVVHKIEILISYFVTWYGGTCLTLTPATSHVRLSIDSQSLS